MCTEYCFFFVIGNQSKNYKNFIYENTLDSDAFCYHWKSIKKLQEFHLRKYIKFRRVYRKLKRFKHFLE